MLGVRLEKDLEKKLAAYVRQKKCRKSDVVKQALTDYLQKIQEEEFHDQKTLSAWAEVLKGQSVSKKQVYQLLDEWE